MPPISRPVSGEGRGGRRRFADVDTRAPNAAAPAAASARVAYRGPMCLDRETGGRVGRRSFMAGAVAAVAWPAAAGHRPAGARAVQVPAPVPVEVAPGLTVLARSSWAGGDLPAVDGLPTEAPGDVRVLLVHHSASGNGYGEDDVAGEIRRFHTLHTGPGKGWPDVAYNFFVDRFGRVWEGRSGSLDGPVIGDATGGNQGFSQLACLIGNFETETPSVEAIDSLTRLLAWIALRDGVDVTPGATTTFTSRGSNLWPAGTTVDTTTIAGHRDMSQTACPGDLAYARVRGDLPALVAQRATELSRATAAPTTPAPTTAAPTTEAPVTAAAEAAASPRSSTAGDGGDPRLGTPLAVAGVVAAAAVAVPLAVRRRRSPS